MDKPVKILVIEDEESIAKVLRFNLEKEGYDAVAALDGSQGLQAFRDEHPDLVLLDVMLPKMNGFDLLKVIRSESRTPVIMLSARKDEVDRVLGLEMGANDYVVKPFSLRELLARIKAILRWTDPEAAPPPALKAGGLEIDFARYEARIQERPVQLSAKEYQFLRCLIRKEGRAMTREELLNSVWGGAQGIDEHAVDQHVLRLRAKLGPEAERIVTVKGVGYRFKLDD